MPDTSVNTAAEITHMLLIYTQREPSNLRPAQINAILEGAAAG